MLGAKADGVKLLLELQSTSDGIATFTAALPPQSEAISIRYHTRTGALLRLDGVSIGAYDREHRDVRVTADGHARMLSLEVELQALPTNGLPAGSGLIWWWLNARSRERPDRVLHIDSTSHGGAERYQENGTAVIGHSHLDVAWLWRYAETERKAQRTFAIACDLLERDADFCFAQSQPQLYDFVEKRDPQLFERVRQFVESGRFDPDVAALWVESDCNLPSGESLLRQMLLAHRYCMEHFGRSPSIAWLPDSFGFANTLPQLLAHAGIPFFATTKLQWNDTTKFPYPQFVWEGPDGSNVIAALLQSYDGAPNALRILRARTRDEPLICGYGDGGGGVTPKMLTQVRAFGKWIRPAEWFAQLDAKRDRLPRHRDELYLEYHRGVYTTHHDIKAANALLERAIAEAEELTAWCHAVGAPRTAQRRFEEQLRAAWEIVLRNQFHDVLPGTAIEPVYEDAAHEHAHAQQLVAEVLASAQTMLPRSATPQNPAGLAPRRSGGHYIFDNGLLRALISRDGTILELVASGRTNRCVQANVLTLYRDRPARWEAWNIDDGYQKTARRQRAESTRIEEDALVVRFLVGSSRVTMQMRLFENEPFIRIDLQIDWRERKKLLRVENTFETGATAVIYGTPHGTISRAALRNTPGERAKFEVPGQRFAAAIDANHDGIAMFSLDTYGWSALAEDGELALGHSLLRGTSWPDPNADRGLQALSYALAGYSPMTIGSLERTWMQFAHEPRVRLFTCDTDDVLVAACKVADDGNGAIVRVRECAGVAQDVRLRCGARMSAADSVDALERPIDRSVSLEGEALCFGLAPFEIRSFRVRFSGIPR